MSCVHVREENKEFQLRQFCLAETVDFSSTWVELSSLSFCQLVLECLVVRKNPDPKDVLMGKSDIGPSTRDLYSPYIPAKD